MKITIKISPDAHKKLQIAKGITGSKTFSEAIQQLAEECIEIHYMRGKK